MPPRRPVPDEALDLWDSLAKLGREARALRVREAYPERFGDLLAQSVARICERESADREARKRLPAPQELPGWLAELVLPYRDCVVIGDVHFPRHSPLLLDRVLRVAERRRLRRLWMNGDIFDFDAYSRFAKLAPATPEATMQAVVDFVVEADKVFSEFVYNLGNHDDLVARKAEGAVRPATYLMKLLLDALPPKVAESFQRKLRWTERYWGRMTGTPDGVDWYIEHQKNFSRTRLRTPIELAETLHAHVLCGHEHHLGVTRDKSGKFYAVAGGTLQDAEHTEYKQVRHSTHKAWLPGFVSIEHSVPHLWDANAPESWWRAKLRR